MVPWLHGGCFRSPCWLSSFASIIPLKAAHEGYQRLCLPPGNAVLSAQGLSCQLQICNLGWPAGPAPPAWSQSVGVGATWAFGGFVSSSFQHQGDPEVTGMVPMAAEMGTMLVRPAEIPWLCYKNTVPGQVQRGTWLKYALS